MCSASSTPRTRCRALLDNALLYAAAHYKVDDILTRDVAGFQDAVRRRVTQLVDKQDLGITVEQCAVQSVPPRQLKDAFASVLKAEVTRSKVLNEARSYENQVTNRAGADAESLINLAQSDRARLVSDVAAQARAVPGDSAPIPAPSRLCSCSSA